MKNNELERRIAKIIKNDFHDLVVTEELEISEDWDELSDLATIFDVTDYYVGKIARQKVKELRSTYKLLCRQVEINLISNL